MRKMSRMQIFPAGQINKTHKTYHQFINDSIANKLNA